MVGLTTIKQDGFIDSSKLKSWKVKVFGAGSIGSVMATQLAKTGFEDITLYDFDKVDEDNIGSQEYKLEHIGLPKTTAIQKLLKDDYGFEVAVEEGEIKEDTEILPEENTIYFCAFDSLEGRNLLWQKLKDFPVVWGESRIGRTSQRYYFVDLRKRDEDWIKEYEKQLDPKGPRTELKCGEKGTYSSNAELVGKIVRQMVNIAEGKDFSQMYIGDWGMPNGIFKMPVQEVPKEITYN